MIALARDVKEYPDAYQAERARRLSVSEKDIDHALRRMNISYKRTLQHPKTNEDKRPTFQETIKAYKAQNRVIVYIVTSGFVLDILRTHGLHPLANSVTVCVIGAQEEHQCYRCIDRQMSSDGGIV